VRVSFTLDFRNSPARRRPWKQFWEDGLWLMGEAEAMGFDALLIQEHFFCEDGYAPSLPVFLTLLAERTRRAGIGAYVYILPLHNPAQVAQETAVLDHLCGGRLEVTVGIGHRAAEYRAFGLDPRTRPSRMEEALEVLRRAWSGEPFDHAGRYYRLEGVQVQPPPLQQPHPPLWVAATTVRAAERAGRHGLHLAAASADPEVYGAYRRALAASGHDPAAFRTSNPWAITPTDEPPARVWERNRKLYFYRWDFYRRIREEIGDPMLNYGLAPAPEQYRDNELIGSPQQILATLEPLVRKLGLTDLVLFGPASGIDLRSEGYASVKRFADDVLPVLKSW
jgi:alkanesulfonate monooxygenase SsuD/methylene tetrahydromethanopterin reductase-like flavin-dependent oxidoreductase (luciferase family)